MFEIEQKQIPITDRTNKGLSDVLREMRVYDETNSFFDSIVLNAVQVQSLARIALDAGVRVKRIKEGEKYRVWRIA